MGPNQQRVGFWSTKSGLLVIGLIIGFAIGVALPISTFFWR
jgi:hypothetical protein